MIWLENRGRHAYEGYRRAAGGRSLASDQALPEWSALPESMKAAWGAAYDAADGETTRTRSDGSPKRAIEMQLRLSADDESELLWALREISMAISLDGLREGPALHASYGFSWVLEYQRRSGLSHAAFAEELRAWLDASRQPPVSALTVGRLEARVIPGVTGRP